VLPVTVASGIDHRGIIAGKLKGAILSFVLVPEMCDQLENQPGANPQRQPPCLGIHVSRHFDLLAQERGSGSTSSLNDLEPTQDIAVGI